MVNFIKKNNINIIVSNIEKEVIAGGIAARICGIPNIRRVGREDDFNNRLKVKWRHRLLVDHCIVPCDLVKINALKRAKWLNPYQFTTIYNGINIRKFSEKEILEQRKKWGLSETDFIIGTTSQLTNVKGIDKLIYEFYKFLVKHPDCYLVITGEGPERHNLKNLTELLNISEKVVFSGFSTEPLKAATAYNIAVSNSQFEGFPNTIVEYFAAGKPVVSTDVGGVSEMVKDGQNGLLISCGNQKQLFEKISLLIENSNLRKHLSQNAINTIKNGFSEDIMVGKLEELFKKVQKRQ